MAPIGWMGVSRPAQVLGIRPVVFRREMALRPPGLLVVPPDMASLPSKSSAGPWVISTARLLRRRKNCARWGGGERRRPLAVSASVKQSMHGQTSNGCSLGKTSRGMGFGRNPHASSLARLVRLGSAVPRLARWIGDWRTGATSQIGMRRGKRRSRIRNSFPWVAAEPPHARPSLNLSRSEYGCEPVVRVLQKARAVPAHPSSRGSRPSCRCCSGTSAMGQRPPFRLAHILAVSRRDVLRIHVAPVL